MKAAKVKDLIAKDLWQDYVSAHVKITDLEEVEKLLKKLTDSDEVSDFKALCEEELSENQKNPIIPRFLATLCGKHPVDDTYALSVFDQFYRDSRYQEAIYVGKKLLEFNESPYVIKALADCYNLIGDVPSKISYLEKLIRIDHNETDSFYVLAEYALSQNLDENALNFYRRVALRHVNQGDLTAIKNLWPKMTEINGNNADFLIQLSDKIAKNTNNINAVCFLNSIFSEGNFDLSSKIKILKKILELEPSNKEATDNLIVLYREKYKENPRLEFCLENAGLLHNYMQANIAVANFEKQIEFNEGAFVYHNTWKLGRIKKIEKDEVFIQFLTKKELHTMSCSMAFSSLKVLPKQHIMVLKAGATKEQIREHLLKNTEWGLKMLLNSFNGQASLKQIKAELVPSIFDEKEWSNWQAAAKKELSSNAYFSTSNESNDVYVLRDTPITFEEKELQIFSREKGFFNKYNIFKDFIKKNGSTDSDEFQKMVSYFEAEANSNSCTGMCSYLILDQNKLADNLKNFAERYSALTPEGVSSLYGDIDDTELKKTFVNYIIAWDTNWQKTLVRLLHVNPSSYLLESIKNGPRKSILNDVLVHAVENYQSDPDFLLYLFKTISAEEWKKAKFEEDELLITKLQLLLFINTKVAHGVDSTANRARAKQLTDTLFSGQEIVSYLSKCDTSSAKRVYSYVTNIPELEEDKSLGIKHFILSKRTDSDSIVGTIQTIDTNVRVIPKGFLCTRSMFNAKTAELEHIMNVEIPENSKDIGTARDLGDLRENAEYQYAKDKQKNLNFMMNKLTDEIDIAKIIDPENVNLDYVEFGTKVVFTDNLNNTEVSYTVLGPWESNPDKNILNFQAPLGLKIYNMKNKENKKFEINGVKYDYTVKSIELADFNF